MKSRIPIAVVAVILALSEASARAQEASSKGRVDCAALQQDLFIDL